MKQMGMNMEEITMAINTDLPESKERIEEAYAFLSENGINEQNYTALKKKTENESDLRHGSMIEFMLHVGMHAEKMREIDNEMCIRDSYRANLVPLVFAKKQMKTSKY